jgi:molybdate transport system substrate-binding protein
MLIGYRRLANVVAGLALLVSGPAQSATALVAVASNFNEAFDELSNDFKTTTGHVLTHTTAATGVLREQIRAGAPFEVLLGADVETPSQLVADGLAIEGQRFTYARGRLVLWSRLAGLIDPQGAVLAQGGFSHIAVANPKLAPYGRAAMEVLASLRLSALLADKLVTGQSIAQAYGYVASGSAELGFVAWSQIAKQAHREPGSYWMVPPALYAEIRQDAVLLKAGARNPAALAFMGYLKSEAARQIIRAHGYAI